MSDKVREREKKKKTDRDKETHDPSDSWRSTKGVGEAMTTSPREARRQISRSYDQNSDSRSVKGYDGATPSRGSQLCDRALIGDGAPSTKIGKEEERTSEI